MLQEVNLDVVVGNGCSRPVGKDVESLVFLQTSHAKVNLLTKADSFGRPNTSKQEVSKLSSTKLYTSHRVMQLFHEKLVEPMLLRSDLIAEVHPDGLV